MIRSQLVVCLLLVLLIATAAATTTASTIVLGHYRRANALDLFVFLLYLLGVCLRVGIQPRLAVLEGIHNLLFLFGIQLFAQALIITGAFCGGAHRMQVTIECVFGVYALLDFLVLVGKHFCLLDHLFDLFLGQATLVVGDGDFLALASCLILRTDVQDAIGVDLERHFDLWLTTRCWWDSSQLELAPM